MDLKNPKHSSFVYEGVTYEVAYGAGVGDKAKLAQLFMSGEKAVTYYGVIISLCEDGTYRVLGSKAATLAEAVKLALTPRG